MATALIPGGNEPSTFQPKNQSQTRARPRANGPGEGRRLDARARGR